MILPESTIIAIRSPIQRLRTLRLPVARPARKAIGAQEWNQPCLLQPGRAYTLMADTQNLAGYDRLRGRSGREPTRARAVVWLMRQVMREPLSVRITVFKDGVVRDGNEWLVSFDVDKDGELAEMINCDEPLYIAPGSGYTELRDELDAGDVMLPFGEDLERARRGTREKRAVPQRLALDEIDMQCGALRKSMLSMKGRNALRDLERARAKLAAQVAADAVTMPVLDRAESQEQVAGEDQLPPSGARSVVSLEAAAWDGPGRRFAVAATAFCGSDAS